MKPSDIDALIIDDPANHVFKVHADVYRSEEIFELERKYIFEGNWMFVGLEAQVPKPHDFITTTIGRQNVIVSRDKDGQVHGLINACRHRGALICHTSVGNAKTHVCPYHAWAYDSAGKNVGITTREQGHYTEEFDADDHGLRPIPRFESYRGFLFGSLNPDVQPLEDFLGDMKVMIDLVVDQSAEGIEMIPGTVNYTYNGNWKMQIENSADLYHFMPTHSTFVQILNNRSSNDDVTDSPYRNRAESGVTRGSMCFKNGHNLMFGGGDKVEARPLYIDRDKVESRVGETQYKWMLYTRNAMFFPNMQLLENASLQIRINRAVSANRTDITTLCIAPKGESAEAREVRIRQYEEFFNPSGLATPDDTSIFEDMQDGQRAGMIDFNHGYLRGMQDVNTEPIPEAKELGMSPDLSIVGPLGLGDETILHGPLREWRDRLMQCLAKDQDSAGGRQVAAQ